MQKFPQENPPLPHHSASTPRSRVPPWQSGPLPPGHCSSSTSSPSLSEKSPVQKPTAGQSSESLSPMRGTRTYSRIHKNSDSESASVVSVRCCFATCLWIGRPLHIQCICRGIICCSICGLDHGCHLCPAVADWLRYLLLCPIEKECDLNKHGRVVDQERKKLCNRDPICNVNSAFSWSFIQCCSVVTL